MGRHGYYEATIHVERDTEYTRWQIVLMSICMHLPKAVEVWVSSFLPESTYEVEVLVSGDVIPFQRGRFYGPPELCYPDEGGAVDITGCWANEQPFELFGTEFEKATEALWQAAYDDWDAAAEDAAVSRYEERYVSG